MVTDLFIPIDRANDFYTWYEGVASYYPLWIVPYRMPEPYAWISPAHAPPGRDRLWIDFAIYGMPDERAGVSFSELLERKTRELGGIKPLIGRNHYDEETFWAIYARDRYERAKRRLDPDNLFRTVFEKRCPAPDPRRRGAPRETALP